MQSKNGKENDLGAAPRDAQLFLLLRPRAAFSIFSSSQRAPRREGRPNRNDVLTGQRFYAHPRKVLGTQYLRRGIWKLGFTRNRGGCQDLVERRQGDGKPQDLVRA